MKKKYILSFLIVFMISSVIYGCKEQHHKLSSFISADTCGGCHDEIYQQWSGSMHHLSLADSVFTELADRGLKGLTDKDEILEAEICQKCHTPIGYISGYPKKTSDDRSAIDEISSNGIQCDYCHSIKSAYKSYNAKFTYDPGNGEDDPGNKRGPFKDSESDYHGSVYSKLHTKSEICGTCHNVRHLAFDTKLDTTYEEWLESPYSKKGVQCQDCHMYQRTGVAGTGSGERPENPGSAVSGSKSRKHIFTHYFVGGNTVVPGMNDDKSRVDMASNRLKNAVDMKISRGSGNKFIVTILNNGAGHSIPTGVADLRQVWLKVVVKDSAGKIVFQTGIPDKKGYLSEKSIKYGVVFGDGKGNAVFNIAKAREILTDRRLLPMKEHRETIDIGSYKGKVKVSCALLYRTLPQKLADTLNSLKGKKIKPVIMKEVYAEF